MYTPYTIWLVHVRHFCCFFIVSNEHTTFKDTHVLIKGIAPCSQYLDDLSGALWCTMSQIMAIDGQHFVIVVQFAIFGSQASWQQV